MKLKGLLCIILLILQSVAFATEHCQANKVISVTASKPEGLKNFTSFPFENDFYFVGEREREGAINFKVSLSVQRPDLTLKAPETNPVTKSTNGGVITDYEVVKTAGGEKKISGKVYLVVLSAEIYETFKVDDDVVIGVSKGESENPKTKLMAEAVGADDWTATIKLIPDDKSVEILAPTELSKSSNLTNIRITKGYEFEKKEPKKLELTFKIKGKEVKVVKNLDLLPLEIRVRQDKGHKGPHGSGIMYSTPRPQNGRAQDELFSLWEKEEVFVVIGGALGDLLDADKLPANFAKWSAPDVKSKINQKEYNVKWGTSGLKVVKLEIGGKEFKVHINVPDTGIWKRDDEALKNHVGTANWALCGALGLKARTNVALLSGQDPGTGDTKQDALRHSTWNLLSAAAIGKDKTITVTTGNEHLGRLEQQAFSSNTTMDLFNNDRGATEGAKVYRRGGTQVDTLAAIKHMRLIFDAGELRSWTPPNNNVNNHHHFLKNSDQTSIFTP